MLNAAEASNAGQVVPKSSSIGYFGDTVYVTFAVAEQPYSLFKFPVTFLETREKVLTPMVINPLLHNSESIISN